MLVAPYRTSGAFVLKRQLPLGEKEMDWDRLVNTESLRLNQREAIILERLSASPRIIDIYGHCGTSMLVEPMLHSTMSVIIPGSEPDSVVAQLISKDAGSYLPFLRTRQQHTTLARPEDKLDLAIALAEAVCDMHGHDGGLIFNSDIRPNQFLFGLDGTTIKLNDFNIASIPEWSTARQNYCKVQHPKWEGRVSLLWSQVVPGLLQRVSYMSSSLPTFHAKIYAPEQYRGDPTDEKVDVFSMGHIFFSLLTGLGSFYEIPSKDVARLVLDHEMPIVENSIRSNSFIAGRLAEIMDRMWTHDVDERPDMFEVAAYLKKTKELNRQQQEGGIFANLLGGS